MISSSDLKSRVVIVQKHLPQYRIPFFEALKKVLDAQGIDLLLIYGQGDTSDKSKADSAHIDWGIFKNVKTIKLLGFPVYWQNVLRHIKKNDLVIVEQANKLLLNYYLLALRSTGYIKLGFWGHGINRQVNQQSFRNKFKLLMVNQADGWFAYTDGVQQFLTEIGVPAHKVFSVDNAIDTRQLHNDLESITEKELEVLRQKLGLGSGPVGIYIGGMYSEKRLDFLVQCCQHIQRQIPDFQMLFVGNGIDLSIVKHAEEQHAWLHYLGAATGRTKASYLKLADVMLMPGLVGLVILDCFVASVPLITTDYPYHSPEIEYLENNENGLITEDTQAAFTAAVVQLLQHQEQLEKLKKGCQQAAKRYTVENMATRFAHGITNLLNR